MPAGIRSRLTDADALENLETVRRLYEAWNRRSHFMDLISPAIDVEIRGGILDGEYRGHVGLMKALDSFWSAFEEARIEVEGCVPSGDDVLVTLRYLARGKESGIEINAPGWHVWTVRSGIAVRWLVLGTEKEALEAAGLSE